MLYRRFIEYFLFGILQALAGSSYFQLFLQKVIKECESSAVGEWNESLQLTVALANLLEGNSDIKSYLNFN